MSDKAIAVTTDANGQVFILAPQEQGLWAIKNISKEVPVIEVFGDKPYVKPKWIALVARNRQQIATNYDALANFRAR